jgi:outer membrane protein assembly factor BamB
MATLEVHDGRGRVEIVSISRDHTALFGSDPKCDVVLDDPQVLPFHGRLRYKGGKYRAEAFPEAQALAINGKKVVAASLAQGDEIKVGAYKIFLVNAEDGPTDTDRTREQAPPKSKKMVKGGGTATASPPAAAKGAIAAVAVKPAMPPKPPGPIKKFMNILLAKDQRPGEEKIVSSPLVLALVVAFALLVAAGIGLYSVISRTTADRQFNTAMDDYRESSYLAALKGFDGFLGSNPHEARAGTARVKRAMASVHQYTSMGAPNWTAALEAARDAYKKVGNEKGFEDDRLNLADLVLKTAVGLAERAKAAADESMLTDVGAAVTLHDLVAGNSALALRGKSLFPVRLAEANAAVLKANTRKTFLADMDAALKAGSATEVYNLRDGLVARYPDFGVDKDVVAKLTSANDLVKKAVSFDPAGRPAETKPHPEALGPPISVVVRSDPNAVAGKTGPIVYAVAQGLLYALDGTNGAPIWHTPIGLTTPFSPLPIAGQQPSCLIYDSRHGELCRLDGRTGKLIWRQSTGETITDPPLVIANQVMQMTPSGKLLSIDLGSGDLKGTLNLGRAASRAPASDEAKEYLYIAGDRDVLYIVKRDPLTCVSVEYLGQPAGSIPCSPAQVGSYLIVAENDTLLDGKWTVYAIMGAGELLRKMQTIPINGWTWSSPVAGDTNVWSVTDRGSLTVFDIVPGANIPLVQAATTPPDANPSGPSFAWSPKKGQIWLSSHRAGRFEFSPEQATITASWVNERAGTALAPIQRAGKLGVFTQRYIDKPGVAVSGLDFDTKKVVWQSVLGTSWPLEPIPQPGGEGLSVLSADGKILAVDKSAVEKGGFIIMPLPITGYFYVPPTPIRRLDANGLTVLVTAPDADHIYVRESAGTADFRRVDLPAPLGAAPLFWGDSLFAPGLDGRVYLVDAKTGMAKAEPYVPPFERSKPTKWKNPVKLGEDAVILADESGRIRRLAKVTEPRLKLAVVGEVVDLKSQIVADPATTAEAVIVATVDGKVRALAARDLSPLGAWTLDAPRALGPIGLGENAVVIDAAGNVLAFAPDGQKLWTVGLKSAPPLGPPLLKDDALWFLSRDGALERRSIRDGSFIDRVDLGVLPTSGMNTDGPDMLVPSSPGTYRTLQLKGEKVAQP